MSHGEIYCSKHKRIQILSGLGAIAGANLLQTILKQWSKTLDVTVTDASFPNIELSSYPFYGCSSTTISETAIKFLVDKHFEVDPIRTTSVIACNTVYANVPALFPTMAEFGTLAMQQGATHVVGTLDSVSRYSMCGLQPIESVAVAQVVNDLIYIGMCRELNTSDFAGLMKIIPEGAKVFLGCTELHCNNVDVDRWPFVSSIDVMAQHTIKQVRGNI